MSKAGKVILFFLFFALYLKVGAIVVGVAALVLAIKSVQYVTA